MKRSKLAMISSVLALIMMVTLLTGCGSGQTKTDGPSATNETKPIVLKFAISAKSASIGDVPSATSIDTFIKNFNERAKGKYVIEGYWDSQLGGTAEELIGGAQNGAFDLFTLAVGNWGEYTDAFMPLNLPYLFKNSETVNEFIDGPIGQKMIDEAEKDTLGVRLLAYLDLGFRHITNNKREIRTPDDLKGLKIRTMSDPYQIATIEAMGASASDIPYSDLYTAIQTGVIDGQENPLANIKVSKLDEVQKYMTLTGHNYTFTCIAISPKTLEKLPDDIKTIIFEEAKNSQMLCRDLTAKSESKLLDELKVNMTVYDPTDAEIDAFRDKAQGVWKMVEEKIGTEYYNEIIAEVEKAEAKHTAN